MDTSKDVSRRHLTAQIVKAYVSKNHVTRDDLAPLIGIVYDSLDFGASKESEPSPAAPLVPAVSVKKSVTPDYLICLEDGKQFKSLKRHLKTHYDLSPEAYRQKWGLPADYPMVAANYAAKRSELAKSIGLGRKALPEPELEELVELEIEAASEPVGTQPPEPAPAEEPKAPKRGRAAKSQDAESEAVASEPIEAEDAKAPAKPKGRTAKAKSPAKAEADDASEPEASDEAKTPKRRRAAKKDAAAA
ncbi:MucR family transcriptional regulator [Aureimonas sp. ME7]|uniref:MucR family transcriptional regulator n=1 Tax=Aureimonas sp. ME7 TaxID=2744252 RepID=UPI0015F644FE